MSLTTAAPACSTWTSFQDRSRWLQLRYPRGGRYPCRAPVLRLPSVALRGLKQRTHDVQNR